MTVTEQAEVVASIDKLLELKNNKLRIPEKLSKFVKDGVFELRVHHPNKISRSFYFFYEGEHILFTNGFIKKSQKTPLNEINKAIKLKKYFLDNIEN